MANDQAKLGSGEHSCRSEPEEGPLQTSLANVPPPEFAAWVGLALS